MTMKTRSQKELKHITESWKIRDDGVILWARNAATGRKINDPVGLTTLRSGHQNCTLYVEGKQNGYSTGQVAWFLYYGEWPQKEIDHIDGNPQNNRKENLRLASRAEQCRNRISGKKGRANKGVYKREYGEKWSAQIWVNNKCKNLGTFDSEEAAINARRIATMELHGEYANLNSYR